MVLLQGHSLTPGEHFTPEKAALTLEERSGSISMELGPEAPEIGFAAWLQDDTEPGRGIVWRVRSQDTAYQTNTRTVQLEHMIQSLRDRVLFGTFKPADMGGTDSGVNARTAVNFVLGKQSDWVLGSFDYDSVTEPWEFTGDSLLDALETISSALADCEWTYDFTVYPFKLNIIRRGQDGTAEMRGARNLESARWVIDRSGMYTRLYPIGKDDLKLPGNGYLSKNEGTYGTICRIETDDSLDTVEKLQAWGQERLDRHCEPRVTGTMTGRDLSESTGEPLDRMRIGKQLRVPLPEFGTAITERICKLAWRDKVNQKENVVATVANPVEDVARIISRMDSSSGGRGARKQKKKGEDHAWFVDTTDHVAMVAEAVAGPGAAQDWSRVAEVIVDGEGIHKRVTHAEGEIVDAWSAIEQTENKIALVVDANGNLKPAKVVAAVTDNNGKLRSEILISADNVLIDGTTTINDMMTVTGSALWIKGSMFIGSTIDTGVFVGSDNVISAPGFKIRTGILAGRALNVVDVQVNGNTLTITYADGTTQTFSKATTLSGAWSSTYGPYRVTASPQGTTHDVKVEFVANGPSGLPIVRPADSGANLFVIDLDVGSLSGSGANTSRTVSAKAGSNVAESAVLTDYGDGYTAGRNSVSTKPTAINVYTSAQGTVLDTRLSASILTSGKYITFKVGGTTYSIPIT